MLHGIGQGCEAFGIKIKFISKLIDVIMNSGVSVLYFRY